MMNQASEFCAKIGASAKSMVKLALQSRRPSLRQEKPIGDTIIIMGNGPSLRQTIADNLDLLANSVTMAVNFAAIAPEFLDLKPKYYILVDPHFFSDSNAPNLTALWANLGNVSWPMTLIIPRKSRDIAQKRLSQNPNIAIRTINPVGIEGFEPLTRWAFSAGLGMPRPRNVMIPAIMSAVLIGYKNIFIVGADHSWMQSISVNDDNEVISVQPHFYKDDEREVKRINNEYAGYRLHQIVYSFYVAFKSYHDIARFAQKQGVNIWNATPDSFIDAFPRRPLCAKDA